MNILTFDIEDWFHILDNDSTRDEDQWSGFESRISANTDRILELLEREKLRATFFVLGWVARRYPSLVKKLADSGYEVASHSYAHQLAYQMTPGQFKDDIERSIKTLEDAIGQKVRSFRVPGFSFTPENVWAFEILHSLGIECDSSIFPAPRGHGVFPHFGAASPAIVSYNGISLHEFPINLVSFGKWPVIFSGGGYFRLLPYWIIRNCMYRSPYVMTYFHPRDFDAAQPVVPGLSLGRRLKSYIGLAGAFHKLERLVTDFHFTDLATARSRVNWDEAKHIDLA